MARKKIPSKTTQQVILGQGIALGCIKSNISGLSKNNDALNQALNYAWLRWQPSSQFPSIMVNHNKTDLLEILEKSTRRASPTVAAFRDMGAHGFVPFLTNNNNDFEKACNEIEDLSKIPLSSWVALAEMLATGFFK